MSGALFHVLDQVEPLAWWLSVWVRVNPVSDQESPVEEESEKTSLSVNIEVPPPVCAAV